MNYNRDSRHRQTTMHSAICSECDQECEVPFKPVGGKPVFCKRCFKNQGDTKPRDSSMTNDQFKILDSKLDKILDLLNS
ncbi:MAG: CxxC-x17-CxxC domain-containing protein [Patescibacteria group bacterium]